MNKIKIKNKLTERRKRRSRAKIFGVAERPRLSVFRSNRYIYVQLIDDNEGKTAASVSTRELLKSGDKMKRLALAEKLGKLIAEKAFKKNIKKVVFDRGAYKYHGAVKAVAEGARKAGLIL